MYYTLDNRSAVYCVYIKENTVWIYDTISKKLVTKVEDAMNIFTGTSTLSDISKDDCGVYGPKYRGNTILINYLRPNHYMYIGEMIYTFDTSEPIEKYISDIGNNLVPYPYAVSENNVYLLAEKTIVPKTTLKSPKNIYNYFYEHVDKKDYERIKIKILKKRCQDRDYPLYFYIINHKAALNDPDLIDTINTYNYFKNFELL